MLLLSQKCKKRHKNKWRKRSFTNCHYEYNLKLIILFSTKDTPIFLWLGAAVDPVSGENKTDKINDKTKSCLGTDCDAADKEAILSEKKN